MRRPSVNVLKVLPRRSAVGYLRPHWILQAGSHKLCSIPLPWISTIKTVDRFTEGKVHTKTAVAIEIAKVSLHYVPVDSIWGNSDDDDGCSRVIVGVIRSKEGRNIAEEILEAGEVVAGAGPIGEKICFFRIPK